jgi:hypothetical protein
VAAKPVSGRADTDTLERGVGRGGSSLSNEWRRGKDGKGGRGAMSYEL